MSTIDDLKDSFAGESQANQKYRAFAKKAAQEGLPNSPACFGPRQRRSASTPKAT